MYSKLLTLFTFTAVALAQQGFPHGPFVIQSAANTSLTLGIEGDSHQAGAAVVLLQGEEQAWTWDAGTGLLTNGNTTNTELVVTAPADDNGIIPGQELTQETENGGVNQVWSYYNDSTVRSLRTEGVCMTMQGLQVIMEPCDGSDDQVWHAIPSA